MTQKDKTKEDFIEEINSLKKRIAELENTDSGRKQQQAILYGFQSERDLLTAVINNISDEIWFTDVNKKFILANPVARKEFSLDVDDKIDVKNLAENLEVYNSDMNLRPIEEAPPLRALRGEEVKNQEEVVRVPSSGELRYRQVSAAPIRDAAGSIIGSVSIVHDITEYKKMENAILKVQRQFQELFDHMSSCVAVYKAKDNGKDFIIMDINKSGEHFSKVSRGEVVGKSVFQVFPAVKKIGLFEVFQQVWKTGEPQHYPLSLYQDERLCQWVENYVYKLPSGEIVSVYDDVTERKNMEEAAKNRLHELEVFHKVAMGREERIIELKKEIEDLKKKLVK